MGVLDLRRPVDDSSNGAGGRFVQSIASLSALQFSVTFEKSASAPSFTDARIMVCDCATLDEDTQIQGPQQWRAATAQDTSTTRAMVQAGWTVQSIIGVNARQSYVVFVKGAAGAPALSDAKIMICDCALFDEDSVLQRASAWAASATTGQTTASAMVQLGWTLHSVVAANLRQLYVTFVQNPAAPVPATTGVKVVLCDACIFDETSTVQGHPNGARRFPRTCRRLP